MTPFLVAAFASLVLQAPATPGLPLGAVLRLGATDFHFRGDVRFVATTSDRAKVTARTADGLLTEYDTATGKPGRRYRSYDTLAYSPDGRTIAVLGSYDAKGWPVAFLDAADGREVGQMPPRPRWPDMPAFAAFAGPGLFVIAGEREEAFHVWDIRAGAEARTIPWKSRSYPWTAAVSPDGLYLATLLDTGTVDRAMTIVELSSGREVSRAALTGRGSSRIGFIADPGNALVFAPDGRSVVLDGTTPRRYEVPSGRLLGEWTAPALPWRYDLAVANNAAYLLLADDAGRLTAIDVATGKPAAFPLRLPVAFAEQPGAGELYVTNGSPPRSAGWHRTTVGDRLGVWDLRTGAPRHDPSGPKSRITGVALLPDGRAVTCEDEFVRVWGADGMQERVWNARSGHFTSTSTLSPDGLRFANDGLWGVRVFDTVTGKAREAASARGSTISPPAFSRDGRLLANPGEIWDDLRVWDVNAGDTRLRWVAPMSRDRDYVAVGFSLDGRRLYSADRDTLREWDVATGKASRALRPRAEFVANTNDPKVGRYSEPNSPILGHVGRVHALAATPDGRRLVSTCGFTLRLWDLELGEECALVTQSDSKCLADTVYRHPLAVSPDGGVLAASGVYGRRELIDFWDLRTGQRFASLAGHAGPVTALGFAPDGRRLISGGADGAVYVWEAPARPRPRPTAPAPTVPWGDLASADAAKAHRALAAWSAAPDAAIAAARRLPADAVDPTLYGRLAADLGSPEFATRAAASRSLEAIGPEAIPQLEVAATSEDLETATRARKLLDVARLKRPIGRPAVDLLEGIGTPSARELLSAWAAADPAGDRGRAAAAALARPRRH